ncbi:MAG: methyl-accepting chemotaxis protein [Thermodesulfobacteriota bacterium]
MSVKQKLVILFCVAVGGFALVFAASFVGKRHTEAALALKSTAEEAFVEALQARRQEKNFIMRREAEYIGRTLEHVARTTERITAIRQTDPEMADQCDKALKQVKEYETLFGQMTATETTVGLSEKDGVRWQFIAAGREVEQEFKEIKDLGMTVVLLQMRRQEKNYIERGKQEYLDRYRNHLAQFRQGLANLPDESRKAAIGKALDAYDKAFAAYVSHQGKLAELNRELIQNARRMEPIITSLRDHYAAEYARISARTDMVAMGIELAAAVLTALLAFLTITSVLRPLTALQRFSRTVASGDLEARPEGVFVAEFGELSRDMSRMVEGLKRQIAETQAKERQATEAADRAEKAMRDAQEQGTKATRMWERMVASGRKAEKISEHLASSSEQLSALITQVKRGAAVQNERMGETATAMEQMNATVLEVAKNAGRASENARGARDRAKGGADMVRQAVAAIAQVNAQTDIMRAGMEDLGRQVNAIGQIMNVITDIADQTNLLALNAAIEAARAGDAGRGFAVVADEVRKLAEKTMAATKEVETSIQSIQRATRQSIDRVEEAAQAVVRSTELANSSGHAQEDILRLVEDSSLQVESIASAAEEQSAASEQINRAIDEVTRIARDTSDGMLSSAQAVEALAATAAELKTMIEGMLHENG